VCPRPHCPGFPIKLLNAMAARKAIVTFRGSAKGLRHLGTAYLAEDHDWVDLARGIALLLEDPALAERLGIAARGSIEGRFDWPTLAARIEEAYARTLGSVRIGRPGADREEDSTPGQAGAHATSTRGT